VQFFLRSRPHGFSPAYRSAFRWALAGTLCLRRSRFPHLFSAGEPVNGDSEQTARSMPADLGVAKRTGGIRPYDQLLGLV